MMSVDMTEDNFRAHLQAIAGRTLEATSPVLPESVADWDSSLHVRVIDSIEERYMVRFDSQELLGMSSIGELFEALRVKVSRAARGPSPSSDEEGSEPRS